MNTVNIYMLFCAFAIACIVWIYYQHAARQSQLINRERMIHEVDKVNARVVRQKLEKEYIRNKKLEQALKELREKVVKQLTDEENVPQVKEEKEEPKVQNEKRVSIAVE